MNKSRAFDMAFGFVIAAMIGGAIFAYNTGQKAHSGTAQATESANVIDLPPGEKLVDASWAHSTRLDSIGVGVLTRDEKTKIYRYRKYLSSESEPRYTLIIREHAADEKK